MRSLISAITLIALCSPLLLHAQEQGSLPKPQDVRLPVPGNDVQRQQLSLIRDIYKSEYDAAKKPEQKAAFARMLIRTGLETENDAAAQYVLFRLAMDIASKAGDAQLAFAAISELDSNYRIDALATKVTALGHAIKSGSQSKERNEKLATFAMQVIDDAVSVDDYSAAKQLGRIAVSAARMSRNTELRKSVTNRTKEIESIESAYERAAQSLEELNTNPADPKANLIAGKFHCFMKGDWQQGLPMLALCDDAVLQSLAKEELQEPTSSSEQVVLGDGWWKMAEAQDDSSTVRDRAAYWYRRALPQLSGLAKTKVAKRLEGLNGRDDVPGQGREEEWISKNASYVLSSVLPNYEPLPYFLTAEGRLHESNGVPQFAFSTRDDGESSAVIDLGENRTITKIYIQNRAGDDLEANGRAATLSVWLGLDTANVRQLVWQAEQARREWFIKLPPTKARYVKIGLRRKEFLHLKHVKVFGY